MPPKFRSPMGRLWTYGLFWYWQFLHQKSEIQRYNLFELSIRSRLYCVMCTRYEGNSIIVLWVLCVCVHFRFFRLTSQRAAQCNGILISILEFPIKLHYMKLLLHASTQIQLSYLRICIFHFSFVPIDLPTVSVCTVFCSLGLHKYLISNI